MSIEMPFTSISVMLPDGREITMTINGQRHECMINGLKFGPLLLEGAEKFAIQTLLNTAF